MSITSYEQVREALGYVPPHDRETWLRIGMAVKYELGDEGFSVWDEWSQADDTYSERDAKGVWKSIRPAGKVTIGTLFHEAKRHGWRGEKSNGNGHALSETERAEREQRRRAEQEAEAQRRQQAQNEAAEIWESSKPAPEDHSYLLRKGVKPHGVRIYSGNRTIRNMSCTGALLIPVRDTAGALYSLEFISAEGEKRFLPGGRKSGGYFSIGRHAGVIVVAEGFATGASVFEATGHATAVAFDKTNLRTVAGALRAKFPGVRIIIAADDDYQTAGNPGMAGALKAAAEVGGLVAVPDFGTARPEGAKDFNDMLLARGADAVRAAIEAAKIQQSNKANGVELTTLPSGAASTLQPIAAQILADVDGAVLLSDVETFVARFCVFPDAHCLTAVTLWAAHAHMVGSFHTTPRLAVLSPEAASGKTRVLEVLDLLVPQSLLTLNASPAAIFRTLAKTQITLLFDEVDAIWSKGGKDDNHEDLRALLNAGYKRGATIPRCVGPKHDVVSFAVYCAVALAGLGDLPDTIMSRSVILRMRRRAPGEAIEPFRTRAHEPIGHALRERLAQWAAGVGSIAGAAWPELPAGIVDRPAEVWEPLIAVADIAGGTWPARAREACVALCRVAEDRRASLGVRLLADLRTIFGAADALHTETIITALTGGDLLDADAPWSDMHGKPLGKRGLASMLKRYGVSPQKVTVGGASLQGYRREHLWDAWERYLPSPVPAQPELAEFPASGRTNSIPEVPEVPQIRTPKGASVRGWRSEGATDDPEVF